MHNVIYIGNIYIYTSKYISYDIYTKILLRVLGLRARFPGFGASSSRASGLRGSVAMWVRGHGFSVSVFLCFCVSVFLGFCVSVFLGVWVSVLLGFRVSGFPCSCVSVFLCFCASVFLGVCVSVFLRFCVSVFLGFCISGFMCYRVPGCLVSGLFLYLCISVLLCFCSRLLCVVTLISVPLHPVPTCSVHGYARARSKSLPGRCLESPKFSTSLFWGRLECCRLTARNHKRSHSSKSRLCASLLGCTSPGSSIAPCMYMHGCTLVYIYGRVSQKPSAQKVMWTKV